MITKNQEEKLNEQEIDVIGEIGNISMGASATALSKLLKRKVEITTPEVKIVDMQELANSYEMPFVAVKIEYTKGLKGYNIFNIKEKDAIIITDLMMGGKGESKEEFSELHLSAMGEVMNQMVGSSATSLGKMLNTFIDISPPKPILLNYKDETNAIFKKGDKVVKIQFIMNIDEICTTSVLLLMPIDFAKILAKEITKNFDKKPEIKREKVVADNKIKEEITEKRNEENAKESIEVTKVSFNTFGADNKERKKFSSNTDFNVLMDVPLKITVELGRANKKISEILAFSEGTIIELDKIAGDTVDILINNNIIGKGEVVVVDEQYGIRITETLKKSKLKV